jgi:hypothetical protein
VQIEKQAFSVAEFMVRHGITDRNFVYSEMTAGRLRTYMLGRKRMISLRVADEWQANMEKQEPAPMKQWPPRKPKLA